jgi:hypothetical protein
MVIMLRAKFLLLWGNKAKKKYKKFTKDIILFYSLMMIAKIDDV